jgi:hypothetical protein
LNVDKLKVGCKEERMGEYVMARPIRIEYEGAVVYLRDEAGNISQETIEGSGLNN